jgi:hypothetical protein
VKSCGLVRRTERCREELRGVRRARVLRRSSGQFYGAPQGQVWHWFAGDGADESASGTLSWERILALHLPVDAGGSGRICGGQQILVREGHEGGVDLEVADGVSTSCRWRGRRWSSLPHMSHPSVGYRNGIQARLLTGRLAGSHWWASV